MQMYLQDLNKQKELMYTMELVRSYMSNVVPSLINHPNAVVVL